MKFSYNYFVYIALLSFAFGFGQDNTIFITSETYKPAKDLYNGSFFYTQAGFSIPITVDKREEYDYYHENNNRDESFWDQFDFDGLNINAGVGFHFKNWVAIGVNTGIDSRLNAKLVAVPVYGTVTLNPHFDGDTSILLQYGYGHAFALGRGDLSGAYSKYKIGLHLDNYILIYLDATTIDLPVNNFRKVKSFSIGIDLMNFF